MTDDNKTQEQEMSLTATTTLRNGNKMPWFGLGTWLSKSGGECGLAVTHALKAGYRLIDTAAMYENEEDVGKALKASGLKRSEYFVVTKLHSDNHGKDECVAALQTSLNKLGLDYVDLYLIHTPKGGKIVETWKGMLEGKEMGLTKAVGVSNFGAKQLLELKQTTSEMPEVNQIEYHIFNQQEDTVKISREEKIAVMGYCPLARCKLFGKTALGELAAEMGRSEADLMMRWSLDQGIITIPKSSNPERIVSNASIMSFSFSEAQRDRIKVIYKENGVFKASNACNSMDLPWSEVA